MLNSLRTLIAIALVGWSSILPVLAHACVCCSANGCVAASCADGGSCNGDSCISTPTIQATCCGCGVDAQVCVDTQVDRQPAISIGRSNGTNPWGCRCEVSPEIELYATKVAESKQQSHRSFQSMPMVAVWQHPTGNVGRLDFNRPVLLLGNQQQKLATLGVWRL